MMFHKGIYCCIGLIFVLVSGGIYIGMTPSNSFVYEATQEEVNEIGIPEKISIDESMSEDTVDIVVYLCGSVVNEGVYTVQEGTRIYEVLEQAGGLTEEAQKGYINLAQTLQDGESIYFPSEKEVEEMDGSWNQLEVSEPTTVNINKASEAELIELSGIGVAKAKAIIKYREKNQRFKQVEDIMNVPGIKENTFEVISEQISVE